MAENIVQEKIDELRVELENALSQVAAQKRLLARVLAGDELAIKQAKGILDRAPVGIIDNSTPGQH